MAAWKADTLIVIPGSGSSILPRQSFLPLERRMKMAHSILGWWFASGHILPHGDGRPITIGTTHQVDGELTPCQHGLHLSVRAVDALNYAPGNIIYRVRGHGTIIVGKDKICCSHRTYLAGGIDITDVLQHFSRLCALDVIHLWNAPSVVIKYLRTGNPRLREAAWAAARDAAGAAAWDAAWAAAWDAARDAAWDAAWAAAWDAARDAAGDKQNRRLHRMLLRAIKTGGTS